jgi:hypothetical protein
LVGLRGSGLGKGLGRDVSAGSTSARCCAKAHVLYVCVSSIAVYITPTTWVLGIKREQLGPKIIISSSALNHGPVQRPARIKCPRSLRSTCGHHMLMAVN